MPLDFIIDSFEKQNMFIDWIDFYEGGLRSNWNIKTILSKIEMALLDTKGKKYSDEVIKRLKHYIGEKYEHERSVS